MGELAQPRPEVSVSGISEADLMEARMGSNGNPTYEEQFGITSAPLGTVGVKQPTLAELELEAQKALARATNPLGYAGQGPAFEAPIQDFNDELSKFKKLYGESENEKGQLRKNQQELMEAFNGLMSQHETLQTQIQAQQNPVWGPQSAPQFGPMPYGPVVPQFQDPFEGVSDVDYLDGKTAKTVIERAVGQATAFMAGQVQQATNRAVLLERQLAQQARAASGVSKLDEFRLTAKNPWLNALPEAQRFAAIQSLKSNEASVTIVPPQVPQATNETQNRILNRVTYIEGTNPNVPDQTEAAIEAAKQRDYAIVMAANAETGERAQMFRAFGRKYGLPIGQNPSDLGR